jgi:enoyl-CoA hydratase/carnithine racemase
MYRELTVALKQAAQDDSVVTLLTGAGKYFSSGNDLSNSLNIPPEKWEKMAAEGNELLRFVCLTELLTTCEIYIQCFGVRKNCNLGNMSLYSEKYNRKLLLRS